MVSRNPVPYFGTPPAEYDQRYMNDLVRSFAQFTNQVTNPGEELTTALTVTSDGSTASGAKITWDVATSTLSLTYGAVTTAFVLEANMTDEITQAERVVLNTYADTVSVADKAKNLNKFGTNTTVGTTFETVAQFQGTTANETFVSTNLIDSVVSSSTSDTTQTIRVEGHTIDGSGNLTFVVQDAILTGQTEVTLGTPLARCTRLYVKASGTFNTTPAALVGVVSCYDNTGGMASGVPTVPAATKCLIAAGTTQSQKCSTSVSSIDYWFITEFAGGIGNAGGSANRVTFQIETRDVFNGGAWLPTGRVIVITVGQPDETAELHPFIIVPKNHDVRVVAKSNASTAEVFAELRGVLAAVQV